MTKTIAVDFDGTMNQYESWGDGTIKNNPISGTIEALTTLHNLGFDIIIFTCRANSKVNGEDYPRQLCMLRKWLNENNLSFVMIQLEGKPVAEYYIDDRGITFNNNWAEITQFITQQTKAKP
jgi:predicted phosphatase